MKKKLIKVLNYATRMALTMWWTTLTCFMHAHLPPLYFNSMRILSQMTLQPFFCYIHQEPAAPILCWIFFQREVKQRHHDVCIGLGNIASAVISRSETRGSCSVQFSVCCGWEGSGRGEGCGGGNTWVWRPRTVLGYENVAVAYVATCRTYSTQGWLSSPIVSHFYYHHQPTIC